MNIPRPIGVLPGMAYLFALMLMLGSFAVIAGCTQDQPQQTAETPQAEETTPARDPIADGRASFEQFCVDCHGADGKGGGELAGELDTPPADLTRLRIQNEGTFPVDAVYQTIEGSQSVEAHGSREMPVWGNIWGEEEGQPVSPEVVEQRINELVEYIRSIQE